MPIYEEVQWATSKAYELVPEVYCQRFRNCKKQECQTYVKFTRELFDHWCATKQVDHYNKLRQLRFIEEFKKCLQSDMKMLMPNCQAHDPLFAI